MEEEIVSNRYKVFNIKEKESDVSSLLSAFLLSFHCAADKRETDDGP
jgi:hypothetical protein